MITEVISAHAFLLRLHPRKSKSRSVYRGYSGYRGTPFMAPIRRQHTLVCVAVSRHETRVLGRLHGHQTGDRAGKQLKGWRRAKKVRLIEELNPNWIDLA